MLMGLLGSRLARIVGAVLLGCLPAIAATSLSAAEATPPPKNQAKNSADAKPADAKPTPAGIEFFEAKIRPVLVAQCYSCHSADSKSIKGGLVLDTRAGIRKGGESGPGVVPGDVKASLLIEAIRREGIEMPPDETLSDAVVADFVKWVEMGAPDPREGKAVVRKIDLEAGKQFWAYQPIAKPTAPQVKDAAWPKSDLDRHLLAALEAKGLQPVADADPITWLRRVTLDLIGLQPTPDEIIAFSADGSPQARAAIVDRLLASPQFGERWGRHWLDVARYGESTGKERNVPYPTAWRYRDYVIDAFNSDKPYDQFIREQIAGDLLPTKTPAERNQNLIATGFLALGPKSLNERNQELYLLDIADEQIDVVCRTVMATTVACARCHDHKFDPIPQTDYYALAGIFRSTDVLAGVQRQARAYVANQFMTLAAPPGAKPATATIAVTGPNSAKKGELKPADRKKLEAELAAAEKRFDEIRLNRKKLKNKDETKAQFQAAQREVTRLQAALAASGKKGAAKNLRNAPPENVDLTHLAMGVQDGKPADVALRIRGEETERGDTVPRGLLSVLKTASTPKIDPAHSGRLELAQWITSKENPLTARVMANRIWFHLFGTGLVETVDNFGALGEKPSHPELLDALARQLMDNGWSVKHTIRTLVLSRAYGLASDHSDAAYAVDPGNRLVWRMNRRRLDAEVIRDTALSAAGTLELTRPVGTMGSTRNGEIGRDLRPDVNQRQAAYRSIYLPAFRGLTNEMLAIFDIADSSFVVGQREVTTVATQALFLLNSPFILEQSDGVAARVLASAESEAGRRVDLMYRLILARPAADHERGRAVEFVKNFQPNGAGNEQPAWSALAQVLFSSAEFRYAY